MLIYELRTTQYTRSWSLKVGCRTTPDSLIILLIFLAAWFTPDRRFFFEAFKFILRSSRWLSDALNLLSCYSPTSLSVFFKFPADVEALAILRTYCFRRSFRFLYFLHSWMNESGNAFPGIDVNLTYMWSIIVPYRGFLSEGFLLRVKFVIICPNSRSQTFNWSYHTGHKKTDPNSYLPKQWRLKNLQVGFPITPIKRIHGDWHEAGGMLPQCVWDIDEELPLYKDDRIGKDDRHPHLGLAHVYR